MDKFPSRERQSELALAARVSAIVLVGGDAATTQGQSPLDLCLRSLLSEPWIDELIVVDCGSSHHVGASLRSLSADRRDVRVMEAGRSESPAAAINRGAAQAAGRWLLFVDPHVVLKRGAVERLTAAAGSVRGPWIVGGRLTDLSGRDRSETFDRPLSIWSAFFLTLGPRRSRRHEAVSAVSHSMMLVSRQDFEELGGFDPKFAGDFADVDLCARLASRGGKILFEPEAKAVRVKCRPARGAKQAHDLARFALKNAHTPLQKIVVFLAAPALAALLVLKDWIIGSPRG